MRISLGRSSRTTVVSLLRQLLVRSLAGEGREDGLTGVGSDELAVSGH